MVMAPMNPAVPADVVKLVDAKKQAIADGSFDIFKGPLKDNTGKIRVPAGATMPNNEYMSINWYVEGIEGTAPK